MNRFLYWSIYGGTFLLSLMLMVASVMAVVGFVPFRAAQPILASPTAGSPFSAPPAAQPSDEASSTAAVRRAGSSGWESVWQARSEPAGTVPRHPDGDDSLRDAGDTVSRIETALKAEPGEATAAVEQRRTDHSAPDVPTPPAMNPPAVDPDQPPRGESPSTTPLIVAGLWPGVIPITPSDPPVEEPADDPPVDEPTDRDQGDAGGGGGGDADGDQFNQDPPPKGPLRLSLVPGHDEVAAGDMVSVKVVLSEADRISSVPFHVRFNSEVLEYVGAKKGPAITSSPVQPILLAAVNPARPDDLAVGLALVRSSGRFSGSGTVVVLDFRALQAGQSDLLLEKASVRDTNSRPLTVQIENSALSVR